MFVMRVPKNLLLLGLVLLLASVALAGWYYFGHEEPVADFTAVEFYDQYKDRKAANQRYVGRSLAIRGEVLSVEYSWLTPHGWKSVALGKGGTGVICHFAPDMVYQADALMPGQVVVVRGVCKGEFVGCPVLSDCAVESAIQLRFDLFQLVAQLGYTEACRPARRVRPFLYAGGVTAISRWLSAGICA
jgi:hypothetical protein